MRQRQIWLARAIVLMESRRVSNTWTRFFWYSFRFLGDSVRQGRLAGVKGRFQVEIAAGSARAIDSRLGGGADHGETASPCPAR